MKKDCKMYRSFDLIPSIVSIEASRSQRECTEFLKFILAHFVYTELIASEHFDMPHVLFANFIDVVNMLENRDGAIKRVLHMIGARLEMLYSSRYANYRLIARFYLKNKKSKSMHIGMFPLRSTMEYQLYSILTKSKTDLDVLSEVIKWSDKYRFQNYEDVYRKYWHSVIHEYKYILLHPKLVKNYDHYQKYFNITPIERFFISFFLFNLSIIPNNSIFDFFDKLLQQHTLPYGIANLFSFKNSFTPIQHTLEGEILNVLNNEKMIDYIFLANQNESKTFEFVTCPIRELYIAFSHFANQTGGHLGNRLRDAWDLMYQKMKEKGYV